MIVKEKIENKNQNSNTFNDIRAYDVRENIQGHISSIKEILYLKK